MMIMMKSTVSVSREKMDLQFVMEIAIKQLNHMDALALDLRPRFLNFEFTEIPLVFFLSIMFLECWWLWTSPQSSIIT